MADTIVSGAITLDLSDGFDLAVSAAIETSEVLHITLSDFNFIREEGSAGQAVAAVGRQMFSTRADAQTFLDDITAIQGTECTIIHDTLTPPGGLVVDCIKHNGPRIQTCLFPGFQVDYVIRFHIL